MNRAAQGRLARLEARRQRSEDDDLTGDEVVRRANDIIAQIVAAEGFDQACAMIEAAMIEAGMPGTDVTRMQRYIRELRDAGALPRASAGDG